MFDKNSKEELNGDSTSDCNRRKSGRDVCGQCAREDVRESCRHRSGFIPGSALERVGVPQSRHPHVLLQRGRLELEGLFPGFVDSIHARGGLEMEIGYDCATLRGGVWAPRTRDKNPMLCASRVLIEAVVRELLRKTGKVQFIERTNAVGFEIARDARMRVTGVKVRPLDGGAEATIATNLVVDASGRTTKIPSWLAAIGLPEPEVTIVDPHTGYATRWFRAVPKRRPREWWWKSIVVDTPEDEVATTGLFPVEENKFTVTMAGVGGKYPPSDPESFTRKLGELRSPIIAEEVALAEPISPVYSYRNMANRWRRYDKWTGDLGGFVALGDSTCAFNPVYGQGMTSCAVGALMLGDVIKRIGPDDPELPRQFFLAQAAFQAGPWGLATGADFRFPTTDGERPTLSRLLAPVFGRLWDIQRYDDVLRERIVDVINMVLPPSALLTPSMLARIAVAMAKIKIGANSSATVFTPTPPTNDLAAA